MLKEDIGREPFEDPLMPETLFRSQAFLGVPFKTHRYEAHKGIVGNVSQFDHNVLQSFFLLLLSEDLKRRRNSRILELLE